MFESIKHLFGMTVEKQLTMAQVAEKLAAEGVTAYEEKHSPESGMFYVRINTDIRDHPKRGSVIYRKVNLNTFFGDKSKLQHIDENWYTTQHVIRDVSTPLLGVNRYMKKGLSPFLKRTELQPQDMEFDAIAIRGNMSNIYAMIVINPSSHPVSRTVNTQCVDETEGLWYINNFGLNNLTCAGWKIKIYHY